MSKYRVEKRYIEHCNNEKSYIGQAIKYYGRENFDFSIVFEGSREACMTKEIELILEYQSNDKKYGYNLSKGGESGSLGSKRSDKQREIIEKLHQNVFKIQNIEKNKKLLIIILIGSKNLKR